MPEDPKTAPVALHKVRPNEDNEPVELIVEHVMEVTQHHKLIGNCPVCNEKIETDVPVAIQAFEQGKTTRAHCKCGQPLVVPGRSKLVKPKDMGRVVVPGNVNNRHARRAGPHLVKG